ASRFGLSGEFLKHLLYRISQTLCSRITWSSLIESTPVRTHETALEYVEHLNDAFLCKIFYCYDFEHSIPAVNKARKLYLIDPLLIYLAQGWKAGIDAIWPLVADQTRDPLFRSKLLENTYALLASRHYPSHYFWYSSRTKREVDLVVLENGKPKLFDVKSGRPSLLDKRSIEFLSTDKVFSWPGIQYISR
ncbi:MAG: ATP-binding protein, partial [Deltaproteobacteria bacterium]|nr:ATP-binding protein [Deltaproteobacteria bacterium]